MTERRLLIIGLDGATFDVVDPLLAAGRLPNLARLIHGGVRSRLRSTIPPVTAAAWPSLLTGKNPARHGIYGFRSLELDEYGEHREFASSRSIAGQTIFDYVGRLGHPIVSYLVPMTFPVWEVNGAMVAGFPSPDIRTYYTWPDELAEELGPFMDFSIDDLNQWGPEKLFPMGVQFTERLVHHMKKFLADPRYRLLMYVVSPLDYIQHRFWALREPHLPIHRELAERYGDVIEQVYQLQDEAIGHLLAELGPHDLVAVVSDHGGGKKAGRFWNVNHWLLSKGWLRPAVMASRPARAALGLARSAARLMRLRHLVGTYAPAVLQRGLGQAKAASEAVDWPSTRAHYVPLFFPAAGINLNLRGRQPQGLVGPGAEYEQLRDEVLAGLSEVTDPRSGRPVVAEAYRREEVYDGPHLEAAPDIVFLTDPVFECGRRLDVAFVDAAPPGREAWTGDHRMEGMMVLHGPGVFRSGLDLGGAQIVDVAPTLLHALGLPLPTDLDGHHMAEAFDPDFASSHPVQVGEPIGDGLGRAFAYSSEEEQGIKASLRGFGYIE